MISKNKNEDAVSPVIGVMLMLVVTVVIAAVVVGFSTGLAGSTGTTPTAMFEVSNIEVSSNSGDYQPLLAHVNFRHKGGDVIPLEDILIQLESVGGENSGLILGLEAEDVQNSIDLTGDGWLDGTSSNQRYQQQKENLASAQTQLETKLREVFPDNPEKVAYYSNIAEYYDDYYDELEDELSVMGEDVDELFEYIVYAKEDALTAIEVIEKHEGWIIEDGVVLGKTNGVKAYPVSVLGQAVPTKSTVSTGEIIQVIPFDGTFNSKIIEGTSVKWTISYIPTNSIIAKGEFEVIAD